MQLFLTCLLLIVSAPTFIVTQPENHLLPQPGECGQLKREQFYNDNEISEIDEFPWTARIAYESANSAEMVYTCMAVLISKQYLMAVAHCVESLLSLQPHSVLLGDWNVNNSVGERDCDDQRRCANVPVQVEIAEIVIHPSYNLQEGRNNVALLRLKQAVNFTDFIRPICLPSAAESQMNFVAQRLWFSGWTMVAETDASQNIRKKLLTLVMGRSECQRSHFRAKPLADGLTTNSNMCVRVCSKDLTTRFLSGSTLMGVHVNSAEPDYYFLVGLAARGTPYCQRNIPIGFERIGAYLDWIKENVY